MLACVVPLPEVKFNSHKFVSYDLIIIRLTNILPETYVEARFAGIVGHVCGKQAGGRQKEKGT